MANKRPSASTPERRGEGDELHQGVKRGERMTTATGTPLGDGQNSLKVGDRGPTLLEDFAFRDKMFHFDHERIPERVVHARGYSAHATLECLDAIPDLIRAAPFAAKDKKTEAFVRFSTVAGNLGSLLNGPESFAGRKLGVLVTDGSDKAVVKAVASAFEDAGAVVEYVAPAIGPVKLKGGGTLTPDHAIDGGPSVLFDAVALLPSSDGADALARRASAKDFVSDAFAHHKLVGLGAGATALLTAAGVEPDEGFLDLASADDAAVFVTRCASLRHWDRDVRA